MARKVFAKFCTPLVHIFRQNNERSRLSVKNCNVERHKRIPTIESGKKTFERQVRWGLEHNFCMTNFDGHIWRIFSQRVFFSSSAPFQNPEKRQLKLSRSRPHSPQCRGYLGRKSRSLSSKTEKEKKEENSRREEEMHFCTRKYFADELLTRRRQKRTKHCLKFN